MLRKVPSIVLVTGLLLAGLVPYAQERLEAQGKGKPAPPPVLVTSTVRDAGATAVYDLQSDGRGPYTASNGVLSQIYQGSGDWVIDLRDQTARTVNLTFNPKPGSPVGPGNGLYNARVLSRCFDAEGNITGFLAITPGTPNTRCSLRIGFDAANGTSYFLVSSPLFGGTSWATVTCVTSGPAGCSQWTIQPGDAANTTAVLYSLARNGKETLVGYYSLTFFIDVTR
jgi:hypothetical protein